MARAIAASNCFSVIAKALRAQQRNRIVFRRTTSNEVDLPPFWSLMPLSPKMVDGPSDPVDGRR
jgi:hypothetical protein